MLSISGRNKKAGIEISSDMIVAALVRDTGKIIRIDKMSSVKIPTNTLKLSFKSKNIIDTKTFEKCLNDLKQDLKTSRLSVALPDTCTKIVIKKFRDLPEDDHDIDDLVAWDLSNFLKVDASDLRSSWEYMGKSVDGEHILLVVSSFNDVIQQFEDCFQKCGLSCGVVLPAGLSRFNFYASKLPLAGNFAYLGLFDSSVSIFVFSEGVPVFYKSLRKGLLTGGVSSAIDDLDLLLQYYTGEWPELELNKVFVASYLKSGIQIRQILQDSFSGDVHILDETQLVDVKTATGDGDMSLLPLYTSAVGAAKKV